MNEFINWGTLGTYGGALAMVMLMTQFTKSIPGIQKIPTQLWSYGLSVVVLLCAAIIGGSPSVESIISCFFNGMVVSIAANGGYNTIAGVTHKPQGQITINSSDPGKDIYSLQLDGDPTNLGTMKHVTFKINKQ